MPLPTAFLDDRMFSTLKDFFPSVCSIRRRTEPVVSSLGEAEYGFPALAGHEAIACALAAKTGSTQEQASEVRTGTSTYTAEVRHCLLDGYYPLIQPEMVAVVDGVEYDIRGVVHSGVREMTKLMLEVIVR